MQLTGEMTKGAMMIMEDLTYRFYPSPRPMTNDEFRILRILIRSRDIPVRYLEHLHWLLGQHDSFPAWEDIIFWLRRLPGECPKQNAGLTSTP